mgnify:CR=1 FL=1
MKALALVIGLTGGIATGKSTVSEMFKEMDIPVVDADVISREVVEPGELAYEKIVDTFGEEVLHPDGTLNRKKLGSIVFGDEQKRKQLNEIVHPEVRKKMISERDRYVQEGHPIVVLDIPLLFESKLTHFVDKTLLIYVDEDIQLKRLMNRDQSTKEEALQRINAQYPISKKLELADAVIYNNGTIEETKEQLLEQLKTWNRE